MPRYLLFDGHCAECSGIARAVRDTAEGRVEPRSLHDPEMRAILDRERPGWRPEPLLVEDTGGRVRVRAGLAMRLRLAGVLGPRRSFRLAGRLVPVQADRGGLGRRAALSRAAGLALAGAGVLAGTRFGSGTAAAAEGPSLVTDEATLDLLRRTRAVRDATAAFGAPQWQRVYRGSGANGPFYVLTHAGEQPTFTAVADPAAAGEGAFGISYRVRSLLGLLQVDWLRPVGETLLNTEFDGEGAASSTAPDGSWVRSDRHGNVTGPLADPGEGDDVIGKLIQFIACFAKCASPHAPKCGGFCIECGTAGGMSIACLQCGACMAGVGIGCGLTCWEKFPWPQPSSVGP